MILGVSLTKKALWIWKKRQDRNPPQHQLRPEFQLMGPYYLSKDQVALVIVSLVLGVVLGVVLGAVLLRYRYDLILLPRI